MSPTQEPSPCAAAVTQPPCAAVANPGPRRPQFIRMVRSAYPVVYRPASVIFLKPEAADGELVQPVHMTDASGTTWLAVYRLQRPDDKGWRIGACLLLPRAGKTV